MLQGFWPPQINFKSQRMQLPKCAAIVFIGIFCYFVQAICVAATSLEGIQVYQKTQLSPAHKKKLAAAIDRYYKADDLWEVLRSEFILPHYEENREVQQQIQWYLNNQAFLMHSATRAAPYLYFILQQVRKRHLPAEVALLPIIESAYNPFAYSSAGAAGIWQMMPRTASGWGIKQDWWYDGRRDVIASTRAALDYLSYLSSFFGGNWLWAIAAYDTGEGNLLNAIRKNGQYGRNIDFWSLPLAQETREYIPRLLALAIIIAHPERYPIDFPAVPNAPYLAQISIGGQIDLKQAASLAGLSLERFKQLNPGYNRAKTNPHGPHKFILPIENVEQFTENLIRSPLHHNVDWIRYKIKAGDTLYAIARQFNTTPYALSKINPMAVKSLKPGNQLLIPKTEIASSKQIAEPTPQNPEIEKNNFPPQAIPESYLTTTTLNNTEGDYALHPGDTLYVVRTGDTVEKIAQHFSMSAKEIMAANRFNQDREINAGEQLIIPTHVSTQPGLSPGDTIYMTRRGDTVEKVAQKYHTTPSAIRVENLLTSDTLREGEQLVIPAHFG